MTLSITTPAERLRSQRTLLKEDSTRMSRLELSPSTLTTNSVGRVSWLSLLGSWYELSKLPTTWTSLSQLSLATQLYVLRGRPRCVALPMASGESLRMWQLPTIAA